MGGGAETVRLATRFGLSLTLNGDDEYASIVDGDVTPANAFDVGVSTEISFGCFFQVGEGEGGYRRVLMGKRADDDDTAAGTAGWMLELTASNTLRLLLDDGTNLVTVETSQTFVDDGFFHLVVVTVDLTADEAKIYASPGKLPHQVALLVTGDVSVLGSTDNTAPFTLGAFDDGVSSTDHFFGGAIQWAQFWNEVLDLEFIRGGLGRFDLPFPDDVRSVSCWHFTNRDLTDWKDGNANDLTGVGITSTGNFGPGAERFPIINAYSITPAMGERPGTAEFTFDRFRPDPLQEAFFKIVGTGEAPPLRLRRITRGATDEPQYLALAASALLSGRHAFVHDREASLEHVLRIYDARLQGDAVDPSPEVDEWDPLGKINLTTAGIGQPSDIPAVDVRGKPDSLFTTGTTSGDFHVIDVRDPSAPSVRSSLAHADIAAATQVLKDAQSDHVFLLYDGGRMVSIDVSDPDTPAVVDTLTNSQMDSTTIRMVQQGDYVFATHIEGIMVIDVSDPTALSFVGAFDNAPNPNEDVSSSVVMLNPFTLMSVGQFSGGGGEGRLITWDVQDPTTPVVTNRLRSTALDQPRDMHRVGGMLWMLREQSFDHHLTLLNVSRPNEPGIVAQYDLSDWIVGSNGAQIVVGYDGDRILIHGNGLGDQGGAALFKGDVGEGFSGLSIDFPTPSSPVTSPKQQVEHARYMHDLSDLDFEDDAVGTDPPTGWTKTGASGATAEVSDVRGLTGGVGGSLPQSLHLLIDSGTNVGVQRDFPLTGEDRFFGTPYLLEFAYLIRGPGSIGTGDFQIVVTETGGVATNSRTFEPTEFAKDRWHRFEILYELNRNDSTDLRIEFRIQNTISEDVYIDSVKLGPGRAPLLFAGRSTTSEGSAEEPAAEALIWKSQFIDKTFDFNRLTVGTSLEAGTVAASIDSLVTDFTRTQDEFDGATNVYELAAESHDVISLQQQGKLAPAITRLAEAGNAVWWLDYFGNVWAMPPNFFLAPVFMNDATFGWSKFRDKVDGAELVTEGTVEGDQSAEPPPVGTFEATPFLRRFGQIQHFFPPTSDVTSQAAADDLAAFFESLKGDFAFEGSAEFKDEQRLRPGMLMPVQIPVRAIDRLYQFSSVVHSSPGGGRLLSRIQFAQSLEDLAGLLTRGSRGGTQDIGTMGFDNPEFGFDNDPAMAFDAVK